MDGALSVPSHSAAPSTLSHLGLALLSTLAGAVVATWCSGEHSSSLQRLLRSLRSSKPSPASAQQPGGQQQQSATDAAAGGKAEAGRPPPRVRSTNSLGAAAAGWVQGIQAVPGCRRVFDAAQLLEGGEGGMADILGDVRGRRAALCCAALPCCALRSGVVLGWRRRRPSCTASLTPVVRPPRAPACVQDHMFAAFVAQGLLDDLVGYYADPQRT